MMTNKKLIKNYIYDVSYQILMLITPLITTPYISRVLGAGNIGIYSYATSIVAYFILFGTIGTSLYGRREVAFYQEDSSQRTKAFWEIFMIRCLLTCASLLIYVISFGFSESYVIIYRILILDILANAIDISWFFQGMQDFKKTVLRNVIVKLGGITLIFLLVKSDSDLWKYTLCISVPTFIGNLSLWGYLKQYLNKGAPKFHLKKHIVPILGLFIPQIAIEIYTVLDRTMIGALCTDMSEVGFYSQAQRMIKILLQVVASIGVVMMPSMALDYMNGKQEKLKESVQISLKFMSFIGIPIMFGVMAISEKFVPWFFGADYEPVIILMLVTAPLIICVIYSTVIGSQYLLATKKQKYYTISVICGACFNFLTNLLFIPKFGALGASVGSVLAEALVSLVQIFFTRKELPILKYTLENLKYFLCGLIMAYVIFFVGHNLEATVITTMIQIVVGIVIYLALLIITKDKMLVIPLNHIKNKFAKHE